MHRLKSMILAFSMYSKIPMPHLELEEKDMKYVMGFFPFVGLVLGGCIYGWYRLSVWLGVNPLSSTLILLILPILITGGIHVDGYMDTMDAIHSYGDREKKLAILKDSHIGAFAVIMLMVYLTACFAALAQLTASQRPELFGMLALTFYLSRILSGISAVNLKSARKNGMLHTFTSVADRRRVNIMLAVQFFFCAAGLLYLEMKAGICVLVTAVLVWCYYRYMAYKQFGGITGDLAGYLLCTCELWTTIVLAAYSLCS